MRVLVGIISLLLGTGLVIHANMTRSLEPTAMQSLAVGKSITYYMNPAEVFGGCTLGLLGLWLLVRWLNDKRGGGTQE